MPKWSHYSPTSGFESGHSSYDSFTRAPFIDLVSPISSLSLRLGQIWVKVLLEPMMALPGRQSEETPKKAHTVTNKTVGYNTVYSHRNMYPPLINIYCNLYLWQICTITISLMSIKRGNSSIQDTKLILLTCFSQSRLQNTCALCISALPSIFGTALESHEHSLWVFLPIVHSNTAS